MPCSFHARRRRVNPLPLLLIGAANKRLIPRLKHLGRSIGVACCRQLCKGVTMGALSAINAAGSFVLFTANDYGWDYFWPNTNVSANGSFHALTSLSRNTAKYLTVKPMFTAMNLGMLCWWTGSAATTAVTGGVIVVGLPLAFYLNNTLWDWYDWRTVSKPP